MGNLVEIDENLLESIILLNKKGYTTDYCCSGHIFDACSAYISFFSQIILPSLPNGFDYDWNIHPVINKEKQLENGHYAIRKSLVENNNILKQKEILQAGLDVLDWAMNLPEMII